MTLREENFYDNIEEALAAICGMLEEIRDALLAGKGICDQEEDDA